ncbi:hypothetical protein [Usitatibacter palustris]|uniref:Beta-barrel assembly machine subunit BamF n=1 Tax=Usitatibacter palustris TaxID=2732487 RepID=A0A6M4H8E6_9PROT|nr:hypothetical protein [Usitatibacter palustris]QJR14983.1 hypothetical protein DSM104440_01798 [Usitatibacter palustris]
MKNALIAAAVAVLGLVAGCATVATPTTSATQISGADQIKRIGSNIPIKDRVQGPELVRMTDAQRDRQSTNQLVSPMMPLKSE